MIMNPFPCFALTVLVASIGLVGCGSPAGPHGEIYVGDTPDLVLNLMGKPDERIDGPSDRGYQATWIYTNQQLAPKQSTGWSEVLVSEVKDQDGRVVQPAVTRDIYRKPVMEDIHVIFTEGLVSSVDHLKR
jgi:hypothetical protein